MSGLLALDMANAAALAAAVRVQSAIREYLETQGVNDVLSDSVAPAQALLRTFEQSGISDHSAPRGRRIKRVTERVVTRMRKKNGYLRTQLRKCRIALEEERKSKRHGKLAPLWWSPQLPLIDVSVY